jgi:hypothetical protein
MQGRCIRSMTVAAGDEAYSLCTVLTMHCTHYALYSLCTVLTMHCTYYALYSLYPFYDGGGSEYEIGAPRSKIMRRDHGKVVDMILLIECTINRLY